MKVYQACKIGKLEKIMSSNLYEIDDCGNITDRQGNIISDEVVGRDD